MKYLLDTNIVIYYLNASLTENGMKLLDSIVDDEPIISVITKIESLSFNFESTEEQKIIETFINANTILNLTSSIINKTIEIRKKHKIKLPDAIFAATALVNDLILITHDKLDFKYIDDLKIIDPYSL